MAFNPFNWFRKHQKVMIAALAVLCMLIFVFQFGAGDPFTRALAFFGRNRQSGDKVTKLYGKDVYTSDLNRIADERKLASDFLFQEVFQAQPQALKELLDGPLKPSAEDGPMDKVSSVASRWKNRVGPNVGFIPLQGQETWVQMLSDLRDDLRTLEAEASRPDIKGNKERVEVVDRLTTILGFQVWLLTRLPNDYLRIFNNTGRSLPPEEFYFGGSRKVDDLLDFMVLKHQADKAETKIAFTDEDVLKAITREAGGTKLFEGTRFAKEKRVLEFLQNYSNMRAYTPKDLMNALREEFRVATISRKLLGHVSVNLPQLNPRTRQPFEESLSRMPGYAFVHSALGVRAYRGMLKATDNPVAITPQEGLRNYRELCTSMRVALLPVEASKFLGQVKGVPTQDELLARYDRYKTFEQLPNSRDPGYKEPRRVAIQGLIVQTDDPAVLKVGRQSHLTGQAVAPLASRNALDVVAFLVADPVSNEYASYVSSLRAGQAQPGQDMRLLDAYSKQLRQTSPLEPYTRSFTTKRLLDRNAFLYTVPALGLASANGLNGLPGGLAALFSRPYLRTQKDHHQAQGFALATLFDPQKLIALPGTLTGADLAPIPLATLRPVIERHLDQEMGAKVARLALAQLKKDLGALSRGSDAKANEIVAKFRKDFGGKTFGNATPLSRVQLVEALKVNNSLGQEELVRAYQRLASNPLLGMGGMPPPDTSNEGFAQWLFSTPAGEFKATTPLPRLPGGAGGLENFILGQASDLLYFWFTTDQREDIPSFAKARPAVEASWRLEKARQFAQDKAEAIQAQINAKNLTPADAERVLREQKAGEPFELDNVAQMVRVRETLDIGVNNYRPYTVPEDMRSKFPYPASDLALQLQVLKRPGEATVIADQPTNTYFVAVLLNRDEPTVKQFRQVYDRTPDHDPLFGRLLAQKSYEWREARLAQLRREAGEVESNGRFKVPAEVRARDTSRSGSYDE